MIFRWNLSQLSSDIGWKVLSTAPRILNSHILFCRTIENVSKHVWGSTKEFLCKSLNLRNSAQFQTRAVFFSKLMQVISERYGTWEREPFVYVFWEAIIGWCWNGSQFGRLRAVVDVVVHVCIEVVLTCQVCENCATKPDANLLQSYAQLNNNHSLLK